MTTITERTARGKYCRSRRHSGRGGRTLLPASLGALLMALVVAAAGVAGAATPTVQVATNGSFGTILTTDAGMALYTLDTDHNGQSTCHGACVAAWPPLTVAAGTVPTGGPGVTGTVAAAKQANGTFQVTYNGAPVYTFVGDTASGQVTGNDVSGFFVVVTQPATTTTTTAGGAGGGTGTSSATGASSPTGPPQSAGTPTASGSSGPTSSAAPAAAAPSGSRATGGSLAFTGPGPWLRWLLLLGLILVMGGVTLAMGPARRGRHPVGRP